MITESELKKEKTEDFRIKGNVQSSCVTKERQNPLFTSIEIELYLLTTVTIVPILKSQ